MPREREDDYDKKLYKEIGQKIDRMNEDEKAKFVMDLAILRKSMKYPQEKPIRDQIYRYLVPKNEKGELDTPLFEKRLYAMANLRIDNIYKPAAEFASKNQKDHSDRWIWEQLKYNSKEGVYNQASKDLGIIMESRKDDMNLIKKAYWNLDLGDSDYTAWRNLNHRALGQMIAVNPDKDNLTAVVTKGLQYTGSEDYLDSIKTEKQMETENAKRQNDHLMSRDESDKAYNMNRYTVTRDMDLGFIGSTRRYDQVSQNIENKISGNEQGKRSIDQYMNELSASLKNTATALKDVSGFRWNDSPEFNRIKDDLADLQEKLKKGNSRENREDIMQSLAKFSKDCKDYQKKNPGVRSTDRGNKRKEVVGNIQNLIEDSLQKVMAPEMEAEMREIARQKNEEVAKALDNERKQEMKALKMSFDDLANEGNEKRRNSVSFSSNSKAKEKEPELGRKSLEPKQMGK